MPTVELDNSESEEIVKNTSDSTVLAITVDPSDGQGFMSSYSLDVRIRDTPEDSFSLIPGTGVTNDRQEDYAIAELGSYETKVTLTNTSDRATAGFFAQTLSGDKATRALNNYRKLYQEFERLDGNRSNVETLNLATLNLGNDTGTDFTDISLLKNAGYGAGDLLAVPQSIKFTSPVNTSSTSFETIGSAGEYLAVDWDSLPTLSAGQYFVRHKSRASSPDALVGVAEVSPAGSINTVFNNTVTIGGDFRAGGVEILGSDPDGNLQGNSYYLPVHRSDTGDQITTEFVTVTLGVRL